MRAARIAAAVGIAAVAATAIGCAAAPPPRPRTPFDLPSVPLDIVEAQELLDRLRAREERIASLEADVTMTLVNERRGRTDRLTGTIAARRPDRYRIRLRGPLGILASDLVLVGTRFRMDIPVFGRTKQGSTDDPRRPRGVPAEALARTLLWRLPGRLDCARRGVYDLLVLIDGATRTEVTVDRQASAIVILGERTWRDGALVSWLVYGRHDETSGVLLPYRIDFGSPYDGLRARIDVRSYRVNPALDDATFEFEPAP